MKCPHCGADNTGRICEYCGSELPYSGPQVQNNYTTENVTHNVTNVYYVNSAESVQQSLPADFPPAVPAVTADAPKPVYSPARADSAAAVSPKNKNAALLLCFFLGLLGAHLFYAGRWKKGLVYLFTGGLLSFGWLIDIFLISANRFKDSEGLPITGSAKKAWLIIIIVFVFYSIGSLLTGSNY